MKKFKTLFEILEAMNRWQMILKSPDRLQKLFAGKDGFKATNIIGYTNLHAYPAIDKEGGLFFFIIPEEYDQPPCGENLFEHIEQAPTVVLRGGEEPDEITEEEAKKRIKNWKDHHAAWLKEVVASPDGMYRAFRIPSENMNSETYTIYFALIESGKASPRKADLVLGIKGGKYDTVRSVPPFDAGNHRARLTDSEDKYHLLSFF